MPINPREVLKGSVVCYEGKVRIVKGVMDYIILEGTKEWIGGSLINGEPLTEVWLERIGFQKTDDNTWTNGPTEICFMDDHYELNYSIRHFNYVHEIQVLHFSLTGEHLKLPKIK